MKAKRYGISQRNKARGSRVWYGRESDPATGERRWVSLGTESKSVALEWLAKKQAEKFLPSERPSPTIEAAAIAYLKDAELVRRLAKKTVGRYRATLGDLLDFCETEGIYDLKDFTATDAAKFVSTLSECAGSTVNVKTVAVRGFFKWALDAYEMQGRNPFRNIHPPKAARKPREFWTVEECERIIAAETRDDVRTAFALMAFAGLRLEEATNIMVESIRDGKIRITGKGGKYAEVPVCRRLKSHLDAYTAPKFGRMFPKMASHNVRLHLRRAAKIAGFDPKAAHPHRFRHSFASNLLIGGASIKAVQLLMRHEDVSLTLSVYAHLLPSNLEASVEIL